jgi:hypothetical protein
VSSAILYLAIVAIWAFLLVPRWVRRSHGASASLAADPPADEAGDGSERQFADTDTGDEDHGYETRDSGVSRPGILRTVGQFGEEQPEPDTAPIPAITVPVAGSAPAAAHDSWSRPGDEAPDQAHEPEEPYDSAAESAAESDEQAPHPMVRPRRTAGPPISRTKILQARRRLMTTLVLLAIAAVSCTALGLTSGWVCVPPAVMLGMYLLLLREAALADAETARWRARQAHAARQRARAQAREAWAARTPQPTAEIIDISARLGDQLYDQYADGTVRAVGD